MGTANKDWEGCLFPAEQSPRMPSSPQTHQISLNLGSSRGTGREKPLGLDPLSSAQHPRDGESHIKWGKLKVKNRRKPGPKGAAQRSEDRAQGWGRKAGDLRAPNFNGGTQDIT